MGNINKKNRKAGIEGCKSPTEITHVSSPTSTIESPIIIYPKYNNTYASKEEIKVQNNIEFCYECDEIYIIYVTHHCNKCNKCHNKYKNIYCIHCNTCIDHSNQYELISHKKNCILHSLHLLL